MGTSRRPYCLHATRVLLAVMAPSFINLLLLVAILIPLVVTLPPIESHASLRPQTSYSPKDRHTGPFRRLRDAIIEKIWSIPGKNTHKGCSSSQPLPQLPRSFHARYGNDVVLRFEVRSEDEAKALSEATSMLYLDIWEATDEWVDIRIAKDVVPSFIGLLPTSLHHASSLGQGFCIILGSDFETEDDIVAVTGVETPRQLRKWLGARAPLMCVFARYRPYLFNYGIAKPTKWPCMPVFWRVGCLRAERSMRLNGREGDYEGDENSDK